MADTLTSNGAKRPKFRFPSRTTFARRTATYEEEPGYSPEARLWLFGNVRLLQGELVHVTAALGPPDNPPGALEAAERETERLVLDGKVLVCGVHSPAHQRVAVVPLRWGSPRIVVFSGGFLHHLGPDLADEPFRTARFWRYAWDPSTDLAVSRRPPESLPTYARHNPTVDRLIEAVALRSWPGLSSPSDLLGPRA